MDAQCAAAERDGPGISMPCPAPRLPPRRTYLLSIRFAPPGLRLICESEARCTNVASLFCARQATTSCLPIQATGANFKCAKYRRNFYHFNWENDSGKKKNPGEKPLSVSPSHAAQG
jgi:hypothetical protein